MQNATNLKNAQAQAVGFSEDDCIEGVFLIEAKSEKTFFNRRSKLNEITGFTDGGFDSFEEDEEVGVWKIITTASFENVEELKKAMRKMEKYKWFYFSDSSLLLDGEYLFVDGKWRI